MSRAIDRHESTICAVLARCDVGEPSGPLGQLSHEGGSEPYATALRRVWETRTVIGADGRPWPIERLDHLCRAWCAVAGIAVPS